MTSAAAGHAISGRDAAPHAKAEEVAASSSPFSTANAQETAPPTSCERAWPPRLYLAIDCGGTKAAAAICDETGDIVGRGNGGPSNYTDNGLGPFLANVEEAVKRALDEVRDRYVNVPFSYETPSAERDVDPSDAETAPTSRFPRFTVSRALASIKPSSIPTGAPPLAFRAAWLGIAGVDSPTDVATLSPHVGAMLGIAHPSPRLVVANDTSLLASPIADSQRPEIKSGVVAIAGTGSIVMSFRRKHNGMLKVLGRIGGFGWLLGDEGSGYAVGRNAVRQILDLADRERLAKYKGDRRTAFASDDSDTDEDVEEEYASACHARGGMTESAEGADEHFFDMDISRRLSSGSEAAAPHSVQKSMGPNKGTSTSQEAYATSDARFSKTTPPSPPPSARAQGDCRKLKLTPAQDRAGPHSRHPYGHMLRDRVLQHWGIASTDELLRSVYIDDEQPRNAIGPSTTTAGTESIVGDEAPARRSEHIHDEGANADVAYSVRDPDSSELSRSDHTLRNGRTPLSAAGDRTSAANGSIAVSAPLLALPKATSSANLLPPPAPTIDVETRLRGTSPIPSLSSSPGSSVESRACSNDGDASTASLPRLGPGLSNLQPLTSSRLNARQCQSYCGDSAGGTELTSAASSLSTSTHASTTTSVSQQPVKAERKHRLASLAPLVFHLAFTHEDQMSLQIVRTQAHSIALQIRDILQPAKHALAHLTPGNSVLCLGGSLVGVKRYRELLVEELARVGVAFARVEFVGDAARRGAVALSHVVEAQLRKAIPSSADPTDWARPLCGGGDGPLSRHSHGKKSTAIHAPARTKDAFE